MWYGIRCISFSYTFFYFQYWPVYIKQLRGKIFSSTPMSTFELMISLLMLFFAYHSKYPSAFLEDPNPWEVKNPKNNLLPPKFSKIMYIVSSFVCDVLKFLHADECLLNICCMLIDVWYAQFCTCCITIHLCYTKNSIFCCIAFPPFCCIKICQWFHFFHHPMW